MKYILFLRENHLPQTTNSDVSMFQQNYDILNEKQREAVETLYGPAMVVAGPGTGKTQIIALRTANIILKAGVNPENILITTFTEAGVIAIRERLMDFIGEEAYKVTVSTIHSFSQDVIKTFPEKFIQHKAGTAIDDIDQMEILQEILEREIKAKTIVDLTSDYDPLYYLRDIKSRISTLKQEGVSLSRLAKLIQEQTGTYEEELSEIKPTLKKYETTKEKQAKHISKLRELSVIYEKYNAYLRESSLYDFNDMITFVLDRFQSDASLRLHYAETYQFVMLDEYQDTNNPQNEIINLILSESQEKPNIMVVGDDDQSIYRFQGANIENMLDFYTVYPQTQFIVLENNYRSNQQILHTAKNLIEHNSERLINKLPDLDKNLTAAGKYKDSSIVPSFYRATSDIEERAYILAQITQEIESGTSPQEIAIILRNNTEVSLWTQFLSQNGIQSESKLQSNILKSDYVTFILSFMRVIESPFEYEHDFINILRTGFLGLSQVDIIQINRHLYIENYRRKIPLKLIDVLGDDTRLEQLNLQNREKLIEFREKFYLYQKKLAAASLMEFLHFFIEDIGILEYINLNGSFDDTQDIYTLLSTIQTWSEANKNMSVEKLFAKINLYEKYNYQIQRQLLKKSQKGVQILTAHSSKGLEYDMVCIPGLYSGNWDSKRIADKLKLPTGIAGQGLQDLKAAAIEEERRLFFVALTRSKNKLFLSFPAGVGRKPLLPSLFLEEISGDIQEQENTGAHEGGIEEIVINEITNSLMSFGELEFEYISEFLKNYRLSPSDFNVFLQNPLEFLNRVIFKYPFSGNKFTVFGSVYHRTLELFYLKYKNEESIPEKSYLTATFSHLIKQELLTQDELEEALEKGIKGLEGYYDLYSPNLKEPFLLEYAFRRKNIFFEGIPLTGTIDKVEKLAETQDTINKDQSEQGGQMAFFKDSVRLIDYKTGKVKTENTVKGIDRNGNKKEDGGGYFRQLMFYKLLCENDREFMSQFDIGSVAIDFVEGRDEKYSLLELSPSEEEYEEFKKELQKARSEITDINFWKSVLTK